MWPAPISPSWSSEGSSRKSQQSPQQVKQSIPKIVTEGASFPSRTPEYIDSPSVNWRKKAHSVAAAKAILSPNRAPPSRITNFYQRKNVLVPSAPSTPPRYDGTRPCTNVTLSPSSNTSWRPVVNAPLSPPPPPPMPEYSSSPVTTPSFLKRLQAPPPATAPAIMSPHQTPPESIPKSRRDDLRIQVSKKMAGFQIAIDGSKNQAAPVERLARPLAGSALDGMKITVPTTPTSQTKRGGGNNQLDFTPPASPVAHRDILRQQQTLQNVLQHKFEEEQLLKEQQEQWLRENFNYAAPTPPISPIKSHKGSPHRDLSSNQEPYPGGDLWDDADDMPDRTPILLRTQSHGLHYLPSPRVTAAVRASRSRLGSLDEPARNEKVFPRTAVSRQSNCSSSVRSSASTELACHRRVIRSLSVRVHPTGTFALGCEPHVRVCVVAGVLPCQQFQRV